METAEWTFIFSDLAETSGLCVEAFSSIFLEGLGVSSSGSTAFFAEKQQANGILNFVFSLRKLNSRKLAYPPKQNKKYGAILENQSKWKIQAESTIATECPLQRENRTSSKNSTAKAPSFVFYAYSQFSENTPPASTSLGNVREICSDFHVKSCENT